MVTLLIVAAAVALLMAIVCVVANRKLCVAERAPSSVGSRPSSAQVAVPRRATSEPASTPSRS